MWNILAFLLWQSRQERKRPGSKFGELIEAHIKDVAEDQCKFSHSDIMMIGWWFEIWRAFHSTWDDQDIVGLSENKAYNFIHWWIIIFPSCSHHFPHEMAASWSPFSDPSHCAQEGQLVPASIVVELLLQAWRPMANRNFLSYTSWINFGYILRGFHSHRGTPNSWKQTGLMENPVISWMLTGDALVQAMREQGWEGGKYLIDGFPRRQAQSVKTSKDFAQFELKSIQGYPSSLTPLLAPLQFSSCIRLLHASRSFDNLEAWRETVRDQATTATTESWLTKPKLVVHVLGVALTRDMFG